MRNPNCENPSPQTSKYLETGEKKREASRALLEVTRLKSRQVLKMGRKPAFLFRVDSVPRDGGERKGQAKHMNNEG